MSVYKIYKDYLLYVGSTIDYKRRLRDHRSRCNNKNNKQYKTPLYKIIRENGGWDTFKKEEIETNIQKDKLNEREEYYRIKLNANMNSMKCYTGLTTKEYTKEYYENNKEKLLKNQNEYREKNKQNIKEYMKEYREKNKEKTKEYMKEYRENHKEKCLKTMKEYREKNKDKLNVKIRCLCGVEISKRNISTHKKRQAHLNRVNAGLKIVRFLKKSI